VENFTAKCGYDIINAMEIFVHLPNPKKTLKKLSSLLNPNGSIVLNIDIPFTRYWFFQLINEPKRFFKRIGRSLLYSRKKPSKPRLKTTAETLEQLKINPQFNHSRASDAIHHYHLSEFKKILSDCDLTIDRLAAEKNWWQLPYGYIFFLKKNIPRPVFVIGQYPPSSGGAEQQAWLLANYLSAKGIQPLVITTNAGISQDFTDQEPYPIIRIRQKFKGFLMHYYFGFRFLFELIKHRTRYNIIHAHQLNHLTFFANLAAKLLKKPLLVKISNSQDRFDFNLIQRKVPLGKWLGKQLRQTKTITYIAISKQIQHQLQAIGIAPRKIVSIPNGVCLEEFAPCSNTPRPAHSLCAIGSFSDKKNFKNLLEACRLLHENKIPFHLSIAGSGPQEETIRRFIQQYGLSETVHLTGQLNRSDIIRLLSSHHYFVLSSFCEGLSNSLLEALAAGLIPIVSDIPANREVLPNLPNDYFFNPHDPQNMAETIQHVLSLPKTDQALGLPEISNYNMEKICQSYLQWYWQQIKNG
jgi:glycosyltransferase involved in cell wall biosynthesis